MQITDQKEPKQPMDNGVAEDFRRTARADPSVAFTHHKASSMVVASLRQQANPVLK